MSVTGSSGQERVWQHRWRRQEQQQRIEFPLEYITNAKDLATPPGDVYQQFWVSTSIRASTCTPLMYPLYARRGRHGVIHPACQFCVCVRVHFDVCPCCCVDVHICLREM